MFNEFGLFTYMVVSVTVSMPLIFNFDASVCIMLVLFFNVALLSIYDQYVLRSEFNKEKVS